MVDQIEQSNDVLTKLVELEKDFPIGESFAQILAYAQELEKERKECLGEMLDCDLVVDSPLEGFRLAGKAMERVIGISEDRAERIKELENPAHNRRHEFDKLIEDVTDALDLDDSDQDDELGQAMRQAWCIGIESAQHFDCHATQLLQKAEANIAELEAAVQRARLSFRTSIPDVYLDSSIEGLFALVKLGTGEVKLGFTKNSGWAADVKEGELPPPPTTSPASSKCRTTRKEGD